MTAATTSAPAPVWTGHPRRWLILAVVLLVECMDLLDGTIVNVAAPDIGRELTASSTSLQWIVGGYALALSVGLVVGGRLGDLYGRKRTFVLGLAGFTLCSLLCGVAPSTGVLIAFRLLQGAAAALMLPQGFGLVRASFATADLPKAFGLFGPVIGLSAVLGPIVGGALVDADLWDTGWRLVFLVNLPLGIVGVIAAIRILPEARSDHASRLDWAGALLVGAAAGLLVYPLIQGREAGWPWWTFAMMAASLVMFVAFWRHARRREDTGRDPLITTSIFRKREYTSGLVVLVLFFVGMMGVMLSTTLFLQLGLGFSAIHAGLSLVPQSLGMAVGAGLSGAVLTPRFGRKVLHAGFALIAIGTLLVILVIDHNGLDLTTWQLAGPLVVSGLGVGLAVAPLFSFIIAGVDDKEVGSASGVLNAVQQLASAIGIAVLGTIFFAALPVPGFVDGMERVLWVQIGVIAVAAAFAFLLPREPREEELH
jgi:EmrB/QacA subfamily drug resistance transporter